MPAITARGKEIRPLTGIRGFASGLVVLHHFGPGWSALLFLHCLDGVTDRGYLGVDLFFILSGFILSYVHNGADQIGFGISEYKQFIWLRFARLWPVHFVNLIILALMVVTARHLHMHLGGRYPIAGLPFQLTMTQSWPFVPEGPWVWNFPSWSISAEWFAYLFLFPAAWHALKRRLEPGLWFVLCYSILAAYFLVLYPPHLYWCWLIVRVTCEFLAGAMLFNVYRRCESITRLCQRSVLIILIALFALFFVTPVNSALSPKVIILIFPLLVLGLTSEESTTAKFFASPPMLWLGRVSYSLYMCQAIFQKILKVLDPVARYQNATLGIRLSAVSATVFALLLAAAALYYFVEVPSRNYLRKIKWGNP